MNAFGMTMPAEVPAVLYPTALIEDGREVDRGPFDPGSGKVKIADSFGFIDDDEDDEHDEYEEEEVGVG